MLVVIAIIAILVALSAAIT
ncbi:MAG: hypothetical protein ACK48U_02135 [Planctomyces sp.]